MLNFYLERNRAAGAPSGERNFHIFCHISAVAAAEEPQHMQLLEKTAFQYLGHRGIPGGCQNMRDGGAQRFEGFLGRNFDSLNPDFVSLLRGNAAGCKATAGGEGSGSINPFVRVLFSGKGIATQMHPGSEETIVTAQQPIKPMRNPSTRRKRSSVIACAKLKSKAALMCAGRPTPTPRIVNRTMSRIPRRLFERPRRYF
jgi:hypothetical protein